MSQAHLQYMLSVLPSANPETLCQFEMPSDLRGVIRAIELMPQGVTAAVAPLLFDLAIQDDAGSGFAAGAFTKESPAFGHTTQMSILENDGSVVEPTTSTPQHTFTLHEQGTRIWRPPTHNGLVVMDASERWGLRYLSGTFVTVKLCFYMEE